MTEKEEQKKEIRKYLVISILFVISISIIGLSLSYAYFTLNFENPSEGKTIPPNTAAKLNVTSDVEEAEAINTENLALIEKEEIDAKAKRVHFTVTNASDSTIDASYAINLVEMKISKNLLSQYFKWKIVVTHEDETKSTHTFNGNFQDKNCTPSVNGAVDGGENGECHYTLNAVGKYTPQDSDMMVYDGTSFRAKTEEDTVDGVLNSTLELGVIESLNIGKTDTIDFYIWLENDKTVDQIYLTNGLFSGKLSITAVPKATPKTD